MAAVYCRAGRGTAGVAAGPRRGSADGDQIMEQADKTNLVALTANIISAYVSNNMVGREDLPTIIADVHDALSKASLRTGNSEREEQKPAVPPKKSVHDDYLICLEDGKKFKSLKRHLRTHY